MADNAAMRDRGRFWRPVPDWSMSAAGAGWSVRRVVGLGQTMISGQVREAAGELASGASEVGLWGVAGEECVLVRISRDKALLVTPSPLCVEPIWSDQYVATSADDAWAVLELSGHAIADLVRQGTSANLAADNRSASVLFAGVPVLLYRTAAVTARLHVEAPLATYLWTWLEGAE